VQDHFHVIKRQEELIHQSGLEYSSVAEMKVAHYNLFLVKIVL
jgi:hypothetical protein